MLEMLISNKTEKWFSNKVIFRLTDFYDVVLWISTIFPLKYKFSPTNNSLINSPKQIIKTREKVACSWTQNKLVWKESKQESKKKVKEKERERMVVPPFLTCGRSGKGKDEEEEKEKKEKEKAEEEVHDNLVLCEDRKENDYHCSIATSQSNIVMEDFWQVEFVNNNLLFVGVYDGHKGHEAADFIKRLLFPELSSKSSSFSLLCFHCSDRYLCTT